MIVLDASATIDLVLGQEPASAIRQRLEETTEVHVPEHFHVEVISALRRLRIRGGLGEQPAREALRAVARLRAVRYPVLALRGQIWTLRDRLTAYDAAYLVLARQLGGALMTTDKRLAAVARAERRLAELDA